MGRLKLFLQGFINFPRATESRTLAAVAGYHGYCVIAAGVHGSCAPAAASKGDTTRTGRIAQFRTSAYANATPQDVHPACQGAAATVLRRGRNSVAPGEPSRFATSMHSHYLTVLLWLLSEAIHLLQEASVYL